jgi:hypothetical protein
MSIEGSIIGGIVETAAKKIVEAATERPRKKNVQELRDRLDILEAQRLVLTVELRSALMREAKKLLPQAIAQAKGKGNRPGSPALLRLIARLAMRDTRIDRTPPKR